MFEGLISGTSWKFTGARIFCLSTSGWVGVFDQCLLRCRLTDRDFNDWLPQLVAKLVAKSHPHVASGFFLLPRCPAMAPVPRSPKAHTARASRGETPCPGAGATERSTERCHGAALGGLRSFLSLRRLVEIVRSVFRILWVNPMGKPSFWGIVFKGFPASWTATKVAWPPRPRPPRPPQPAVKQAQGAPRGGAAWRRRRWTGTRMVWSLCGFDQTAQTGHSAALGAHFFKAECLLKCFRACISLYFSQAL